MAVYVCRTLQAAKNTTRFRRRYLCAIAVKHCVAYDLLWSVYDLHWELNWFAQVGIGWDPSWWLCRTDCNLSASEMLYKLRWIFNNELVVRWCGVWHGKSYFRVHFVWQIFFRNSVNMKDINYMVAYKNLITFSLHWIRAHHYLLHLWIIMFNWGK